MLARTYTSALFGLSSFSVTVEAQHLEGKRSFILIGLGDNAVKEAGERIPAALTNSGFVMPSRVLVNLAPAEVKKEGSSFDLPIAVALLRASRQLVNVDLDSTAFYGELSLDGSLKPVRGIVALIIEARARGCKEFIIPFQNAAEARLIPGIDVVPFSKLTEVVNYLHTGELPDFRDSPVKATLSRQASLKDVIGQERAKRAFQIAAVGGHNIILIGPPGCGKSMLALRFNELLPALQENETHEVVKIHSIASLPIANFLAGERPFRNPHHGVSEAGLIGGGSTPRPGEISLAHRGVLFLDEFPEFRRSALESLRGPLENQEVSIARAKATMTFPADFQLIAAMNPCPCGNYGISTASCTCSANEIRRYLNKLSQPMLDRIDLQIELDAVPVEKLSAKAESQALDFSIQDTRSLRNQLILERGALNSRLKNSQITSLVKLSSETKKMIEGLANKGMLSARGYFRVLRVARTIADLAGSEITLAEHFAEAMSYRVLDKFNFQRYKD